MSKLEQFSSKYVKTLHYEDLEANNNFLTVIHSYESINQYASDLIVDLYNRRAKGNKKILIISEFFWLNEILEKAIIEELNSRKKYLEVSDKLVFANYKSANEYFDNYYNNYFDVIIALNFSEISNHDEHFFKFFKKNNPNSILVGIDISNEFVDNQFLNLDSIDLKYIQDEPNSFSNFVNIEILSHIEVFVMNFHNHQEITQLHDIIFHKLSKANQYDEHIVSFGTSDYVDAEEDYIDSEDDYVIEPDIDIKGFVFKISVSRYDLKLYIELQEYDHDGTLYFEYYYNFEDEIIENVRGKMYELNSYMDEVWERYRKTPNYINFEFIGF